MLKNQAESEDISIAQVVATIGQLASPELENLRQSCRHVGPEELDTPDMRGKIWQISLR